MLREISKFCACHFMRERSNDVLRRADLFFPTLRVQTVPFFFLFSSLRRFLLGLAVHTLAVRDVAGIYVIRRGERMW